MARIPTRQAALLFRRLGTGLGAGVDVRRVWELEASRGPISQRKHAQTILNGICEGKTIARSMDECDGYFPPMARQLVDVGEQTGKLEAVLDRLADHYDHVLMVRRAFLAGIAWPAMQLGMAVVIVGLLIWIMGAVIPTVDGKPVDLLGLGLFGTSGLIIYLLIVSGIAGGIVGLVMSVQRGWLGQGPILVAMHIPIIGKALQTMCLSRFSWSLALALESGLDARRSMAMALRSTQSRYYTVHMKRIDQVILEGGEFHEALRRTRVFPDELVDTLAAGELSGTQAETMLRLSDEYRRKANTALKMFALFASGATWLFVAGIIVMLIMRLAMFYIGQIYEFLP